MTLTTICGTDLHIVRGEYPVQSGLVIGHELVGAPACRAGPHSVVTVTPQVGADLALDYRKVDVVAEVKRRTGGGADVAIEAT